MLFDTPRPLLQAHAPLLFPHGSLCSMGGSIVWLGVGVLGLLWWQLCCWAQTLSGRQVGRHVVSRGGRIVEDSVTMLLRMHSHVVGQGWGVCVVGAPAVTGHRTGYGAVQHGAAWWCGTLTRTNVMAWVGWDCASWWQGGGRREPRVARGVAQPATIWQKKSGKMKKEKKKRTQLWGSTVWRSLMTCHPHRGKARQCCASWQCGGKKEPCVAEMRHNLQQYDTKKIRDKNEGKKQTHLWGSMVWPGLVPWCRGTSWQQPGTAVAWQGHVLWQHGGWTGLCVVATWWSSGAGRSCSNAREKKSSEKKKKEK